MATKTNKPGRTENGGTEDFLLRFNHLRLADVTEFRGSKRGGFGWKIRKDGRVEVFGTAKGKVVLKMEDAMDLATAIIANLGVKS